MLRDDEIQWPPDWEEQRKWRFSQVGRLNKLDADGKTAESDRIKKGMLGHYVSNPHDFITDWCNTVDPRNAGSARPVSMPFMMFRRQYHLIDFLQTCMAVEQGGLIEKSRDMGATWVSVAFSVWLWLFVPGAAIGWGSRKAMLVDRIGDMDSIFEKARALIRSLPDFLLPKGFTWAHMSYMKIYNPATDASITGESGDNIGRGGRKLIYFKDESAHYDRPELIEAALADNTRVQIDISSVHGMGNVFHRRRESGITWEPGSPVPVNRTLIFVMDWRDHPDKDLNWYEQRKSKATEEGLEHVFAQEVDRSYGASVQGTIIKLEWIKACIDAHKKIDRFPLEGDWTVALDVADEGRDTNAQTARKSVVLMECEEWGGIDTTKTARKSVSLLKPEWGDCDVHYDVVGVGVGVKGEVNSMTEEGSLADGIRYWPWSGGAGVWKPEQRVIPGDNDTPTNFEFYENLKAQAWWSLARRLERTYNMVTNPNRHRYDVEDLISFNSETLGQARLRQIEKELCQVTRSLSKRGKLMINKSPEGTRSPNVGDSIAINYTPAKTTTYDTSLSWVRAA